MREENERGRVAAGSRSYKRGSGQVFTSPAEYIQRWFEEVEYEQSLRAGVMDYVWRDEPITPVNGMELLSS